MASGNSLLQWGAASNEPPATNYATIDTRNAHMVLDFNATTPNESAVFSGVMPQHYAGGGVTVYLYYCMTSATTGDVDWDVAFERLEDTAVISSDAFAAVQSVDNTTVPGVAGTVDVVSIAFTNGAQMDSVVAGDYFRIKVTRDGVSDTTAGTAELLKVEVRET